MAIAQGQVLPLDGVAFGDREGCRGAPLQRVAPQRSPAKESRQVGAVCRLQVGGCKGPLTARFVTHTCAAAEPPRPQGSIRMAVNRRKRRPPFPLDTRPPPPLRPK